MNIIIYIIYIKERKRKGEQEVMRVEEVERGGGVKDGYGRN